MVWMVCLLRYTLCVTWNNDSNVWFWRLWIAQVEPSTSKTHLNLIALCALYFVWLARGTAGWLLIEALRFIVYIEVAMATVQTRAKFNGRGKRPLQTVTCTKSSFAHTSVLPCANLWAYPTARIKRLCLWTSMQKHTGNQRKHVAFCSTRRKDVLHKEVGNHSSKSLEMPGLNRHLPIRDPAFLPIIFDFWEKLWAWTVFWVPYWF